MSEFANVGRRASLSCPAPLQLSLFDVVSAPSAASEPRQSAAVARPLRKARAAKTRKMAPEKSVTAEQMRIVGVADLPAYAAENAAAVDRAIKSIPTDRVLLCYKEIQDYLGVSKSNVIRRMRAGLVPGVRLCGRRLVEEGPIRKLDREQIRWLLLSLRSRAASPC